MSSPVVLIVDDHASFRRVARRMLEAAGFAVDEAANGTDAVAASRSGRYDLVLLDVQLPDFDGFEVARRLAASEERPLVVLTSSRSAADYGLRIRTSPVAGFVAKTDLSGRALCALLAEAT